MVKNIITGFIAVLSLCSCAIIYDKDKLMPQNQIGIFNSPLKTEGYYYMEDIDTLYEYNRIGNSGAFEIDSSRYNTANTIIYWVFNKEGYISISSSITDFDVLIPFSELHSKIQKRLSEETNVNEYKVHFFRKNVLVWCDGVFRAENNKIHIQFFYNSMGNYRLANLNGIVGDSTITATFFNKKRGEYKEIFKFMPFKVGNNPNYIQENPQIFWKRNRNISSTKKQIAKNH